MNPGAISNKQMENNKPMFPERWKPYPGYENEYIVSTHGRVVSLPSIRPTPNHSGITSYHKTKLMKHQKNSDGYYRLGLWKNGKPKMFSIHRLVARAFIPNPEHKPQINHIDGDKTNNNVTNLEWVTPIENTQHAIKNGLIKHNKPRNKKGQFINQ